MKRLLSYRTICSLVAVSALALGACTDTWNDHYDTTAADVKGGSLWQAIEGDSQLSNFARVLKACGYDAALRSSQVFTVFAPTDQSLTSAQADSIIALYNAEKQAGKKDDDNLAIKEFVQNHIALYNYSASSLSNDSVVMMNGKYTVLTPNTFGGSSMAKKNSLYGNGVLFILTDQVPYNANVFERIGKVDGLDSVARFLYSYNEYEFDASQSVAGGIVDGRTVYLDSVMVLQNKLFQHLGLINNEDSSYWMVVPTNDQWNELIPRFEQCYNYASNVAKRDSLRLINSRLALLRGTVFSRTFNTDESLRDSAVSVNAYRRYQYRALMYGNSSLHYYQYGDKENPRAFFDGLNSYDASNGRVFWNPAQWPIDSRETFLRQVFMEGESRSTLKEVASGTKTPLATVGVAASNPFYNKLSNNAYGVIEPSGSLNPDVTLNIENVLSNTPYDIYLVIAPALAGDTLASMRERLPTKFRCALTYKNANNADETYALPNGGKSINNGTDFTTTPDVVDSVLVGKGIVFPTCTYGLEEPQVTLQIKCRVGSSDINANRFNRIIRLDQILLVPSKETE